MDRNLTIDIGPLYARLEGVERQLHALSGTIESLARQPRWVGVAEAASELGVHPRTVRRALARGELPSRRVGRKVLVSLARETVA